MRSCTFIWWPTSPLPRHAIFLILQLVILTGLNNESSGGGGMSFMFLFATAEAPPTPTSPISASHGAGSAFLRNSDTNGSTGIKEERKITFMNKRKKRRKRRVHQLLQVQIVHRHGDRTPITPMRNETYWKNQIPTPHMLHQIAKGTRLIRDDSGESNHAAKGRGPFGQLTNLGVLEMVELGSRLREELHLYEDDDGKDEKDDIDGDDGTHHVHRGRLFTPQHPIHPHRIKVTCTNFPRTIQSVQGLLVGLFPDIDYSDDSILSEPGKNNIMIDIDVRHTSIMIPDPQPRRTKQQEMLEQELASRAHIIEKELEMRDFAVKMTNALSDHLGTGADNVSFGVGEEKQHDDDHHGKKKHRHPLSWSQLSEITKCLQVRNLLPNTISKHDAQRISSHSAWRWFEHLRHPKLAKLAMNDLVCRMVDVLHEGKNCPRIGCLEKDVPWLHIYSAHDSTLVGLLCAFQLESPAQWPGYASYLKVELIKVETLPYEEQEFGQEHEGAQQGDNTNDSQGGTSKKNGANKNVSNAKERETLEKPNDDVRYYVRFSLNGELLLSRIYDGKDEADDGLPSHMIPLERLTAMVQSKHNDMDEHLDSTATDGGYDELEIV